MKTLWTIFVLLSTIPCKAQIEHQQVFFSLNVPVNILSEKKTVNFSSGKVFTENKEEQKFIQINANLEDMKIQGDRFSGVSITTFPVYEEIVSFHGTFTKDRVAIETLYVDYQFVKYSLANRAKAHLEETKKGTFTFTNIPKYMSGYKFDHERTTISKVTWKQFYYVKYTGMSETRHTTLHSLNKEAITKYTNCISLRLRNSNTMTTKNSYDKVAVMTNIGTRMKGDSIEFRGPTKGIMALLINKFSKVPGLKVLEREELHRLLAELELSESGLVSEETKLKRGKMLEEDILIIIQLQETYLDENGAITGWLIEPVIVEKESGKAVNPKLTVKYNKEGFDLEQLDYLVYSLYSHVMKHYFSHL